MRVTPIVMRCDSTNPLILAMSGKRFQGISSSRCSPCSLAEISNWVSLIAWLSLLLSILLAMSFCSFCIIFGLRLLLWM